MVLLTSSTISLALSSGIIFVFTFLLFLSGYVLQQQTVRGLQEALRAPPPPKPTLPAIFQNIEDGRPDDLEDDESGNTFEGYDQIGGVDESIPGKVGKGFGHPPGSSGHQSYEQSVLSSEANDDYRRGSGGNQHAYIQLLSNPEPSEICSAILLFKTLEAAGRSVRSDRLILYPKEWDLDLPSGDVAAAMAMLHAPNDGFKINHIPIELPESMSSRLVEGGLRESSLSLLRQYTSILYLRSPGLIVDAKKLDHAFHSKSLESSSSASDWASPSPWIPTTIPEEPLGESGEAISPVLFVSSSGPISQRSSLEFYVPGPSSSNFASLMASSDTGAWFNTPGAVEPAYIHFDMEEEGLQGSNPYLRAWQQQRQEMCPGIDLAG